MHKESEGVRLKLLERLDVSLAARLSRDIADGTAADFLAERQAAVVALPHEQRARWIAGTLAVRGLVAGEAAVVAVLDGSPDALGSHERELVKGLNRVLDRVHRRGAGGVLPNGWFIVELFRELTLGLAKFRNNHLRKDLPWDALGNLQYVPASSLTGLLDTFTSANRYRDLAAIYDRLHPVRQSFRLLWRLARIGPFPDLNLVMGFIGMNAHLLASGYPMVLPEPTDRAMLTSLVTGPPPQRIVQFEMRLLAAVDGADA